MRTSTIGLVLLALGAALCFACLDAFLVIAVPRDGLSSHGMVEAGELLFGYLMVPGPTVFVAGAITCLIGHIKGRPRSSGSERGDGPCPQVKSYFKAVAGIHIAAGALATGAFGGFWILLHLSSAPEANVLLLLALISVAQFVYGMRFLDGSLSARRPLLAFSLLTLFYAAPLGTVAGGYSLWVLLRVVTPEVMSKLGEP